MQTGLTDRVAFITGAARGQGRSHAVRLAAGADVIAVDICSQIDSVPYPMATPEDLNRTVREVEALGRRIFAGRADVRDESGLQAVYDRGAEELGAADIVLANAGIAPMALNGKREAWRDAIDVNLTGVFNTVEVAIPSMIKRGSGGVIILIGSTSALTGLGDRHRAVSAIRPPSMASSASCAPTPTTWRRTTSGSIPSIRPASGHRW